jgi:hypothetical protein
MGRTKFVRCKLMNYEKDEKLERQQAKILDGVATFGKIIAHTIGIAILVIRDLGKAFTGGLKDDN